MVSDTLQIHACQCAVADPGFQERAFRDGARAKFKNNIYIPKFSSNARARNDHEAENDVS